MLHRLAQTPFIFFLFTLGLSLGASVVFASALYQMLPIDNLWMIAVIASLIITSMIFGVRKQISWPNETLTLTMSAAAPLIITIVVGVFIFGEPGAPLPPGADETLDDLSGRVAALENKVQGIEGDLRRIGLSVIQVQEIQETYVRAGQITVGDLTHLGLNQTQMQQVEALLQSQGFMTKHDFEAQATLAAEATKAATCYVQPIYRTINIRRTPEQPAEGEEDNILGVLSQRETVPALGHSGGIVNNTKWWLIELPDETHPDRKQGWVFSGVVKTINTDACENLPRYRR
jgi:hypothetical protein